VACFYEGVRNVGACRGVVTANPQSAYHGHPAFDSTSGCCEGHRADAKTRAASAGDDFRGLREAA
jgi:hypothetical protein